MPDHGSFTFFSLLKQGVLDLEDALGNREARVTVEAVLLHVFSMSKAQLVASFSENASMPLVEQFFLCVKRLQNEEPLAYVLGEAFFMGNRYRVKPGVLIPRPETEGLVERVVSYFQTHGFDSGTIFELGTGSGIISLEVGRRLPGCRVLGWDISESAATLSEENRMLQGCDNVQFFCGDFFEQDLKPFVKTGPVVIVSNPPYIPSADVLDLSRAVRDFEPHLALDGGEDGAVFYQKLMPYLSLCSAMFFEIGYDLRPALENLYRHVRCRMAFEKDFAGLDRYFVVESL